MPSSDKKAVKKGPKGTKKEKKTVKKVAKGTKKEKKTKNTKDDLSITTYTINNVIISYNIKYNPDYKHNNNIFKDISKNLNYVDCMIEAIECIREDIHYNRHYWSSYEPTKKYEYFDFKLTYELNPNYYVSFNSGNPNNNINTEWTIKLHDILNLNGHFKSIESSNGYIKVNNKLSKLYNHLKKKFSSYKNTFTDKCLKHIDNQEFINIINDKPNETPKSDVKKDDEVKKEEVKDVSTKTITSIEKDTKQYNKLTLNNFSKNTLNKISLYGFIFINVVLFYFVYNKFYV